MRADRAPHLRIALGNAQDRFELPHARADRDHQADAGRLGARQHALEIFGKARIIEMAMAVDDRSYPSRRLLFLLDIAREDRALALAAVIARCQPDPEVQLNIRCVLRHGQEIEQAVRPRPAYRAESGCPTCRNTSAVT